MPPPNIPLAFPGPTLRTLTVAADAPDATVRVMQLPGAARTSWRIRVLALRATAAFTLVEMLVVMAVIGVLIATTVPVFKNLLGGRAVEKSINSVTGIIELARATSISNRTFSWVVFKNVINSDHNSELRCAAVMTVDGSYYYNAANFAAITNLIRIPNVKSVMFSALPQAIKDITPSDLTDDKAYVGGPANPENTSNFPKYIVGGQDFAGAAFIRFDDDGEISTSDPYNLMVQPQIALGLAMTRGTVVQANATDGAIVAAYGGSGRMRIIRP